jgi:hypothetical protein
MTGTASRAVVLPPSPPPSPTAFGGLTAEPAATAPVRLRGPSERLRPITAVSSGTVTVRFEDGSDLGGASTAPGLSASLDRRSAGLREILSVLTPGAGVLPRALHAFMGKVAPIPEVRAVTVSLEREVTLVWTYLTTRDRAAREHVYRAELELMESFPGLTFDFNVVPRPDAAASTVPADLGLEGRICCYYASDSWPPP